ncbi:MAG TPA: hypothetical protein VHG51_12490 [Longimicrobiaceae bacterium]|nr:hypothetical protein [Longimicrobiaceae bacterium]
MQPVSRTEPLSRSAFHARLRDWYEEAFDGDSVGDSSSYGGRPWVWVRHGGSLYVLSADTTYEGVGEYVDLLDAYGDGLAWAAAPGAREPGALAFGPERRVLDAFHLRRADPA